MTSGSIGILSGRVSYLVTDFVSTKGDLSGRNYLSFIIPMRFIRYSCTINMHV